MDTNGPEPTSDGDGAARESPGPRAGSPAGAAGTDTSMSQTTGDDGGADDGPSRLYRATTWVLALALVASLVGVGYIAVTPQQTTEPYTEFYVLGPSGVASDYPSNLTVGETGEFIVGITNREHQRTAYTIVLSLNGSRYDTRSVTVEDGATWEDRFSVTPQQPGRQQLRILLYRGNEVQPQDQPYRTLRLWITVAEPRDTQFAARTPR